MMSKFGPRLYTEQVIKGRSVFHAHIHLKFKLIFDYEPE